jgi:predicted metal-binding protein
MYKGEKMKHLNVELDKIYDKYIKLAYELGATDVVAFKLEDIIFDERTLLKCAFGCTDFGKAHTCPSAPNSLGLDMYRRVFSKYRGGIIIHTHDKRISQEASFAVESKAFTDGLYWAFSLSDCAGCNKCQGHAGLECPNKKKARPAFHSVGIDVFATVKQFDLPLFTLSSAEDEQNWYSAVFID